MTAPALLPTLQDIRDAQARLAAQCAPTPLVRLDATEADTEIWLKLENLQPIGSFKIRGAASAMTALPDAELARGVVTASAGNMAQGVAWCARQRRISCTVIAPDTAPVSKVAAIERLGGRVIRVPFERWWQTFRDRAYPGIDARFIHAFDDPLVMAGNGTIGLEILDELPGVETVVVPWGGGGLACGIGAAIRSLKPRCRVVAAECDAGAPLAPALSAGVPVEVPYRPSFVDGIGSRSVFPGMLERAKAVLAGSITVDLDEVGRAVCLLAMRAKIVAEGAGACSVAAALSGQIAASPIVCIVSGGNIDPGTFATLVRKGLPS